MRMGNRLYRFGKSMLPAACLLALCGATFSCSDEYDLPDTTPSFLGGSILDELKKSGNFSTEVRLIEDLNYADVLSKTGSKTLFVANDDAFAAFFRNNPWGVTSYEQLTINQKRYLLANSMLDNAYVLEMLPNLEGGLKNEAMRRVTSAAATDTIAYFRWNQLPENQNETTSSSTYELRYWDRFRNQAQGGIYLALDASVPMMTHFIDGHLRQNKITRSDVAFILNDRNGWSDTDADRNYIYNRIVKEGDKTCMNGYYNVLDSVLLTPPNMAEAIRQNPTTKLFSQMLDRFSAPYYNGNLTAAYGMLHDIGTDSIFEKRYISSRSQGRAKIGFYPSYGTETARAIPNDFPYLTFDPGWNTYSSGVSANPSEDMGAMFVPSDDALAAYFIDGGGKYLMESYATRPNTRENLSYNLYQIPLNIVRSLINNLMKDSFVETVPSKYATITNDAQDRMFPADAFPSVDAVKAAIDKCILANNGVVYVMNQVVSPADYAAVSGPVVTSDSTRVMAAVIQADENFIDGSNYNAAPFKQYFTTYLKAMQSHFSFFVPTDRALSTVGYVDPVQYAAAVVQGPGATSRYWKFHYAPLRNVSLAYAISVRSQAYKYTLDEERQATNDSILGQFSANTASMTSGVSLLKRELLTEMVNQHILVHENAAGLKEPTSQKYFLSRSGAPIYIKRQVTADNGKGMVLNGGFQIEESSNDIAGDDNDVNVTLGYDMTSGYGNGMTYLIDRPMQPAMSSVYKILSSDADYAEFFKMCRAENYTLLNLDSEPMEFEALLDSAGLFEGASTAAAKKSVRARYSIFDESGTRIGQGAAANPDKLIRFFNNYRYTIFVPSNAAMQSAIAAGLPTWSSINDYMRANVYGRSGDAKKNGQQIAQAMITELVNFLRYHFMDESVFLDNVNSEKAYQSSCFYQPAGSTGGFLNLGINQTNNSIAVKDIQGQTVSVNPGKANVLARDMELSSAISTSNQYPYVKSSSYVVIHQLNGYLNYLNSADLRQPYSGVAPARRFLSTYRIRK